MPAAATPAIDTMSPATERSSSTAQQAQQEQQAQRENGMGAPDAWQASHMHGCRPPQLPRNCPTPAAAGLAPVVVPWRFISRVTLKPPCSPPACGKGGARAQTCISAAFQKPS